MGLRQPAMYAKYLPCSLDIDVKLRQPCNTREAVKIRGKAQDLTDSMLFHDSEVDGIACREARMAEDNLLGTLDGGPRDVKHLIDDAQQSVECRLDGISAVNGDVAMQDLLQYLGVGDEALATIDQLLEQALSVALVGVRRAHQIHGDVRIDQNHGCASDPYPTSISASMRSMSAVG